MRVKILLKFLASVVAFSIFILSYAAIYTFHLSNEFLFSTATYEPSYMKTIADSEKLIKMRLIQKMKEHLSAKSPGAKRLFGDEEIIKAMEAQFTLSENIVDFIRKENGVLLYRNTVYGDEYISKECRVSEFSHNGKGYQKGDYLISCDYHGSSLNLKGTAHMSVLEPSSTTVFTNLLYPEKGLKNNLFWRMAYFSTVTATTLGYGEIVPITNPARAWVASESIFGLILMGCFVYWITSSRKNRGEA